MTNKNKALLDLCNHPDARFWRFDFDQLTEPERVFRAIWELEGEVNNGGFDQYFWNSSGDIAYFAPYALDAVGARTTGELARQANGVFPGGQPSPDRAKRQQELDALDEAAKQCLTDLNQKFYTAPDDLTDLLYKNVMSRQNEIGGL